jgi:type II secretory pathway pseudopilin PulG
MQNLDSRRTFGLTLIEMLVASGMFATVAAIAIPNLLDARKGANESSAISTCRTLVTAQALYQDATSQYAGSFGILSSAGFLPADFFPTVEGSKGGYLFSLCAHPCGAVPADGPGYKVLAVPASAGSGNRVFSADDSAALLATVGSVPMPTDEVIDLPMPTGATSVCQTGCVVSPAPAMPSQVELDAYEVSLIALFTQQAIPDLDALVPEATIPLTIDLIPTSAEWNIVLAGFDANFDSALDWDEILSADYLSIARAIKPALTGPDPGPSVATDSSMTAIAQNNQTDLAFLLERGKADEGPSPPISLSTATGNPVALLTTLLTAVPLLGWLGTIALATALMLVGMRARQAA